MWRWFIITGAGGRRQSLATAGFHFRDFLQPIAAQVFVKVPVPNPSNPGHDSSHPVDDHVARDGQGSSAPEERPAFVIVEAAAGGDRTPGSVTCADGRRRPRWTRGSPPVTGGANGRHRRHRRHCRVGRCGGGPGPAGRASAPPSGDALRPFSEVQASDVAFEADPLDPTRGIFHVTTSEPMICAIVWGPTEDLGRLNNSMAMDGTGIVDHDVYLPDVETGRTYYYVIAGVTADGTQYRSDLDTFVIPETATAFNASPRRRRTGVPTWPSTRPVTDASSEYSSQFAAGNAIDGDLATEWSSAGDGDDGWITVRPRPGRADCRRRVRDSVDGRRHGDHHDVHGQHRRRRGARPLPGRQPGPGPGRPVDVTGRVLRFDVDASTGGNVGAAEIRVFAAAG